MDRFELLRCCRVAQSVLGFRLGQLVHDFACGREMSTSVRNYVSPWVAEIEKYTVHGVRKTLQTSCIERTLQDLGSGCISEGVVTCWYRVVMNVKKRKTEQYVMQRYKQGATIPVQKYARFVSFQEISSNRMAVMFVPGITLSTIFYVANTNCVKN
jgi:hypothetical protein